jgi:uracil-DNA glycosylase family 4
MSNYEAVELPEEKKGKRGRGRPLTEITGSAHLYNFPGPTKMEQMHQLYEDWHGCQRCFLGQLRHTQNRGDDLVFFSGNTKADILIIGEAPGEQEEAASLPFIGPAGQMLNQLIAGVSDDPEIKTLVDWWMEASPKDRKENQDSFHAKVNEWREGEFAITNVVACKPPDNRQPTLPEIKSCWERLWNTIYIVDPLLIIACGNTALTGVTGKLSAQITKVRGQVFEAEIQGKIGKLRYPVIPIFHPSYLSRMADWSTKGGTFDKTYEDLKKAVRVVDFLRNQYYGTPVPRRWEK